MRKKPLHWEHIREETPGHPDHSNRIVCLSDRGYTMVYFFEIPHMGWPKVENIYAYKGSINDIGGRAAIQSCKLPASWILA